MRFSERCAGGLFVWSDVVCVCDVAGGVFDYSGRLYMLLRLEASNRGKSLPRTPHESNKTCLKRTQRLPSRL